MDEILIKKIDKIYDECKEAFKPDLQFSFNYSLIKDNEKKHFFIHILNYFVKRKQEEVIKNEKYN